MHTILDMPLFEDRRPQKDAVIWRIALTPTQAFKLICDIGHLYPNKEHRPRLGAMLEATHQWALYLWPKVDPDSGLLLLLLDYGAARLVDAGRWEGQAWITGDLLYRTLAILSARPQQLREAAA